MINYKGSELLVHSLFTVSLMKAKNVSPYQDSDNKERIYYVSKTKEGLPIYYHYEVDAQRSCTFIKVFIYDITVIKSKFLWFEYVSAHSYKELGRESYRFAKDQDLYEGFIKLLQKAIDEYGPQIISLDQIDILTKKLRTFDGLIYKDQIRGSKVDNLLNH